MFVFNCDFRIFVAPKMAKKICKRGMCAMVMVLFVCVCRRTIQKWNKTFNICIWNDFTTFHFPFIVSCSSVFGTFCQSEIRACVRLAGDGRKRYKCCMSLTQFIFIASVGFSSSIPNDMDPFEAIDIVLQARMMVCVCVRFEYGVVIAESMRNPRLLFTCNN